MLDKLTQQHTVQTQPYRTDLSSPRAGLQEAQSMPTEQFSAQDPSNILLAQTLEVLKTMAAQNQQLASQNQQLASQLAAASATNQQISDKLQQQKSGPVRFRDLPSNTQKELKTKMQAMSRNGRLFLRGFNGPAGFKEDPRGDQLKRLTSGGAAARLERGKPIELVEMVKQLDVENHSSYRSDHHQKYLWSMKSDGMTFGGASRKSERGYRQEDKIYGTWSASPMDSWEFMDWEDSTAMGLPTAAILREGVKHPIEELNIEAFQSEDSRSWGLLFKGGSRIDEGVHDKRHEYKPGAPQLASRSGWVR
jgi:hypothetical protein